MVVKNTDWMDRTLPGKAAMFTNFGAKIGGYAGVLPLTLPQITVLLALCEEYLAVYNFVTQAQATVHSCTEWRDNAFSGEPKGDPLDAPPAFPTYAPVVGSVIGMLNVFREWRELIVALPGYTQAIGEDLMIVKPESDNLIEADVVPKIQIFGAQSGYLCSIIVSDRGESDQWVVETRKKGGDWINTGTFTGKSADFTVAPVTPGDPLQIEVRVQLRRKNANYGQLSQIATTTLNP